MTLYKKVMAVIVLLIWGIVIGQCIGAGVQDLRADKRRYEYNKKMSEVISAYRELSAKHYEFFVQAESTIVHGLTAPRDPENVPEIWSTH